MRLLALLVGPDGPAVAALGGPAGAVERTRPGAPSEVLPILVREAALAAGLPLSELDGLAVLTGPGSFTASRAAVAAVRALALATGRPVHAVSALELAAAVAGGSGPLVVMAAAGRGDLAVQRFAEPDRAEGGLVLLDPEAAAAVAAAAPRAAWVAPPEEPPPGLARLGPRIVRASVGALLGVAAARVAGGCRGVPGPAVRPLYLRPPDARPEAGRALVG